MFFDALCVISVFDSPSHNCMVIDSLLLLTILLYTAAGTTSTSTVLMAENLMHMMLDNRYVSSQECVLDINLVGLAF